MSRHTDTAYEAELAQLSANVTHMGALALSMVRDAVRACFDRDADLARAVIRTDDRMDVLELETDQRAMAVVARRSPVGDDLRFVLCVMKGITDLERMGDLAVNIAERGLDLVGTPGISPGPEIRKLADSAEEMVAQAMTAWRTRDAVAARALKQADLMVDGYNRQAFGQLIRVVRDHPDQFERALALSSICRHLERVGDHAVNLGERVVFWVEGEETRHGTGG